MKNVREKLKNGRKYELTLNAIRIGSFGAISIDSDPTTFQLFCVTGFVKSFESATKLQ